MPLRSKAKRRHADMDWSRLLLFAGFTQDSADEHTEHHAEGRTIDYIAHAYTEYDAQRQADNHADGKEWVGLWSLHCESP